VLIAAPRHLTLGAVPGQRAPESDRREQIIDAAFRVACATRLGGLTIRAVAKEAGLSTGLVLFHFDSREQLLLSLLDWLRATTIIGVPDPAILALPSAKQRMLALMRQELELIPARKARLELFFDFWVIGLGNAKVRGRMRKALQRYRDTLAVLADQAVLEEPERYPDVTGADLASMVAAVIEGCAFQAIVDSRSFSSERVLQTLAAVVG
jgi:TetR/AcrR family transcriptional repressor of bet genes